MKRTLNIKLVAIMLGSISIGAVGVHFLHGYQIERNAYRLLERADLAFASKDYAKAENYYEQYLKIFPNQADTLQKLAETIDLANNPTDHVRRVLVMEQVLRAKPNEHAFRMRLAQNLITVGRLTDAVDHLTKLKEVWEDKAEILHILGWCHEAKKEYGEAATLFREAIRLNPKQIKSYILLAEILQDRQNESDEALKVMDDLIAVNGAAYSAHLARARFHRRRGEDKLSSKCLQAALKLGPTQPEVILEVADAARAKGDLEEATRVIQEALKKNPDNARLHEQLANLSILRGNPDAAIASLLDGIQRAPGANELSVLLIDLMIDKQQYAPAQEKINALRAAGMRPALPNYLQARIHVAQKNWTEAIKLLEDVRRDLGPQSEWSSRVHALLGLSYRQMGDREQELLSFRRAVADEPTWTVASVGLATALLGAGRSEEACQVLEPMRTLKQLPAGYWILLSRARLQSQLRARAQDRRWDPVEEALAQATKTDAGTVELPLARAAFFLEKGDIAEASTILERAKTDFPREIAVWCAVSDLSARQGRFADAEAILEQASQPKVFGEQLELRLAQIQLWGRRGSAVDRAKLMTLGRATHAHFTPLERARLGSALAETWYRLGDWDKAEARWRDVARSLPKDVRSRSWLLDLALLRDQPAAARQWLEELRRAEGDAGILWRYGTCAILVHEAKGRRGNLDEARRQLQEIERLHKNWPRAAILAGAIAELEGNFLQAIRDYSRALDQGESQPRILGRVLELLIQRREFGKAEAEVTKYEHQQPLTPELARLAAEVGLGMRDKQSAKTALRRAESAIPEPIRDYRDAIWLASICQLAGESARAEKLFEYALAEARHAPDTWIAWMEFLAQTNQRERGRGEIERMKNALPKSRQALTLARAYEALKMPDQALSAYRAAVDAYADDFTILDFAADFYRRGDRDEVARTLYERLVDPAVGAPADIAVNARRRLAILLTRSPMAGQRERAIALLDENRDTRGDTLADLRVRLFVRGQDAEQRRIAIDQFQETSRRQLPTADETLLLAELLDRENHPGQARTLLADVVDEHPTNAQYLARFGHILVRLEEFVEARRILSKLEQIDSESDRTRGLRAAITRAEKEAESKKMP